MHELTFRVLVILRSGEADGNAVLNHLRASMEESTPSLPTLYRSIRAALEVGWLELAGTSDNRSPGRPRQIFRLTTRGWAAVDAEAKRLRDLAALALDDHVAGELGKL